MNTGDLSGGEDRTPPEYRVLNDEAFVVRYLAYIRKYEMIDSAAGKLGMDPALIKRWVQDNGQMLGSAREYRADEIRAASESFA